MGVRRDIAKGARLPDITLVKTADLLVGLVFHSKSVRVTYQSADKCTTIDPMTAEHIELISSLGDKKGKFSLFGCLNHCSTRGNFENY